MTSRNSSINKNKQGKTDVLTLLVFISFFFVLLVFNNLWDTIDCHIQDFWQRTRVMFNVKLDKENILNKIFPRKDINKDIVLFLIDDKSVLGVPGLFNEDRSVYAKALRNLKELNPKVVGFEGFFPNTESNEKDIELGESILSFDNIVIKCYKDIENADKERKYSPPAHAFNLYINKKKYNLGNICSPLFFKHIYDNTIRLAPLFYETTDSSFPSFFLSIWAKYNNISLKNDCKLEEHELNKIKNLRLDNNYLYVNNNKPLKFIYDKSEYMLINYDRPITNFIRKRFGSLYYNDSDITDDNFRKVFPVIEKSEIENKVVIIGFANSMIKDKYYTPFENETYSPYLTALAVANLLENSWLSPNNSLVTVVLTGLILLILYFVFSNIAPTLSLIITVIINLVLLVVSLVGLMHYNCQINIVAPCLATTLAFGFIVGKKYYIEFSEKKHIKSAFQHYVTASVVNEILKDPAKLNLHGEERNLTIFFSDIEGFTTLAEGMQPLEVVSLLNEYLTAMTDIIFEYDGLLDKYEGDAIMAVFGAPVDQRDHATRACQCALKNQKVLNQLREKWRSEGKPEIKIRIGLNTGIVVVGNMGSTMRFDYTVIGDNVNLASRLEVANKLFSTSILVSGETAELASAKIISRKIAKLKALGKSTYTDVYELLADRDSDSSSEIAKANKAKEIYEQADNLMQNREFTKAEELLSAYLQSNENDLPAKSLYNKIKGYILIPPPADWQNIISQDEK